MTTTRLSTKKKKRLYNMEGVTDVVWMCIALHCDYASYCALRLVCKRVRRKLDFRQAPDIVWEGALQRWLGGEREAWRQNWAFLIPVTQWLGAQPCSMFQGNQFDPRRCVACQQSKYSHGAPPRIKIDERGAKYITQVSEGRRRKRGGPFL